MVDFHSHILPGIDDGSRDIEQTIQMLRIAGKQQVTDMVATSHFYADTDSITGFLEKRQEAVKQVEMYIKDEEGFPRIHVGAEVYYFSGISEARMLPDLCIGDSSLIMIEMPFAQWTKEMYEDIKNIIERRKLTVILAHVERYYAYQKRKKIWKQMLKLPVYFQINAGNLLNKKKKKVCFSLIKSGLPVLIGSDCHGVHHRSPNMMAGKDIIINALGTEAWDSIEKIEKRILQNNE